jgi:hypothetical protein
MRGLADVLDAIVAKADAEKINYGFVSIDRTHPVTHLPSLRTPNK